MLDRSSTWKEKKLGLVGSYYDHSKLRILSSKKREKDFELVWGNVSYDIDPGIGRPIATLFVQVLMWLVSADNLNVRAGHFKRAQSIINEHGLANILSSLFRDEFGPVGRALIAAGLARQAEIDVHQSVVDKQPLEEEFWRHPFLFSETINLTIADGYLEFCLRQAEAGQVDPSPVAPVLFAYDFVADKLTSPLERLYLHRFIYVATFEHDAESEPHLEVLKRILQDNDIDALAEPLDTYEKRTLIADLKALGALPDSD
ncbi:MAG: hypothetical protein ABJG15_10665 [Hyphomonadaceae bacterium]